MIEQIESLAEHALRKGVGEADAPSRGVESLGLQTPEGDSLSVDFNCVISWLHLSQKIITKLD
jgi:hypothetical protein